MRVSFFRESMAPILSESESMSAFRENMALHVVNGWR